MFHYLPSGLHPPLLQTRQRVLLDSLGQCQSPPPVAQIVGQSHSPITRISFLGDAREDRNVNSLPQNAA
jgi:hypothetical protein